jgi:hypothetical protein
MEPKEKIYRLFQKNIHLTIRDIRYDLNHAFREDQILTSLIELVDEGKISHIGFGV